MNLFVNTQTKQYRNRSKKNTKCRPDTKEGNVSRFGVTLVDQKKYHWISRFGISIRVQ